MKYQKQKVIRVDKSPMNPKMKVAQLACGHDVWLRRAPTVGKSIKCERCAEAHKAPVEKDE